MVFLVIILLNIKVVVKKINQYQLLASYLNKIREHLRKLIDDKRKKGEWKIQLVLKINFISSKNFNETGDMYSRSDNL